MRFSQTWATALFLSSMLTAPFSFAEDGKRISITKNKKTEIVPVESTTEAPCENLGAPTTLTQALEHLNDARKAAAFAERKVKIERWTQWWTNFGGRSTSQTEYERSLAAAEVIHLAGERFSVDLLNYVKPTISRVRLAWHRLQRAQELRQILEKLKKDILSPRPNRRKIAKEIDQLKAIYAETGTPSQNWYTANASDLDLVNLTLQRVDLEIRADEQVMIDRFSVYKGMIRMMTALSKSTGQTAQEVQIRKNATLVLSALESRVLLADFFRESFINDQATPTIEQIQAYIDGNPGLQLSYLKHRRWLEFKAGLSSRISTAIVVDAVEKFFTRIIFNQIGPIGEDGVSTLKINKQKFRAVLLSANSGRLRRTYLPTIMRLNERVGDAYWKAVSLANSNAGTNNELLITFARIPVMQDLWYEIFAEAEKSVVAEQLASNSATSRPSKPVEEPAEEPAEEPGTDDEPSSTGDREPEKASPPVIAEEMTPTQIARYRGLAILYRDMKAAREVADRMDTLRLEGGAYDAGVTFSRFVDFMAYGGLGGYGGNELIKWLKGLWGFTSPRAIPTRFIAGQTFIIPEVAPLTLWEEHEMDTYIDELQAIFQHTSPEEMVRIFNAQ